MFNQFNRLVRKDGDENQVFEEDYETVDAEHRVPGGYDEHLTVAFAPPCEKAEHRERQTDDEYPEADVLF